MTSGRTISPPPLSVGIVCASATRRAGGIFPVMRAHAKQLIALGIDVTMHCVEDEMIETDRPSWNPVPLHAYPASLKRFALSPGLKAALLQADYDILHQHGLWQYPSIAVSRWRRRTGRPVVISTQGMLEPWALANAKVKKQVAAWLFERANLAGAACIQCSVSEVAGIRSFGLKNPIAVIANGADMPAPQTKVARPSWLPDDGRRTLLFLGRLHPKKGIRETLDAWALLSAWRREVTDAWRLVFVGCGDRRHADAFIAHARSLGLADVIFPGSAYGDDAKAAYAHADAFILASHSEGLPMAVLEAWSHGLPVFMTRGCNLVEGFAEGAAIEVSTEPTALAAVLGDRLAGGDLGGIGVRGRVLLERQFSWPSIGRQIEALYHWLAGSGSRPAFVNLD
jgi:glycosyltransferase involved in cell wall biosynthesis